MTTRLLAAALLLLGVIATAPAHAQTEEEAALKRAAERGHQIFLLDQAAWVSTDELLRKAPDPGKLGVAGWIVEQRQPGRFRSTYYGYKDKQPVAVFMVDTNGQDIVASYRAETADEEHLTPVEVRMIQARETARRQTAMLCTDAPANTVVIPPPSADGVVEVYVMSAQVKDGEYPLGGHQLFSIGADGKVVSQRKFTNSCLNMSRPAEGGSQPAALMVSHLLDTTPTEIHVFTSESAGLPVYVAAPVSLSGGSKKGRVWQVNGQSIKYVDDVGG